MRLTRRLLLSSAALIPGAALAQPTLTTPHAPRWNQKRLYGPRAGKYGPQNLPTQGPSLSLDFTAGTLDPSITFTRATTGPATYFDSAGTLRTAVINYSTWSQAISNWGAKPDSTLVDNSAVSPDGTVNATLVTEGSAGTAQVQSTVVTGLPAGSTLTYSMYVKRGNTDWLEIIPSDSGTTNGATTWFNTATGLFGTVTPRGAATGITTGVTAAGNGWYRLRWTLTQPGTSTSFGWTFRTATADNSITRVANGTYYVWGVQVEIAGAVGVYVPTGAAGSGAPRFDYDPNSKQMRGLLIEEARTNLATNSGAPGNWTLAGATWGGSATAPDGTNTARLLVEDTSTGNHAAGIPAAVVSATQYAISFFAKAATRSIVQLNGMGLGAAGLFPQWDLSAGTDISTGSSGTFFHGIQPIGNGWYRCWVTFTTTNTTGASVLLCNAPGGTSYAGNGASGAYVWGAQQEQAGFLTSYIPTTAAAATRPAEVATLPITPSPTAFSFAVDTSSPYNYGATTTNWGYIEFNDGTSNNRYGFYEHPQVAIIAKNGGTQWNLNVGGTPTTGAVTKAAVASSAAGSSATINAAAPISNAVTCPAGLNVMQLGNVSGYRNGYLRRLRYWNRVLTNTELQQVTT